MSQHASTHGREACLYGELGTQSVSRRTFLSLTQKEKSPYMKLLTTSSVDYEETWSQFRKTEKFSLSNILSDTLSISFSELNHI